jgi:hypothetical protein
VPKKRESKPIKLAVKNDGPLIDEVKKNRQEHALRKAIARRIDIYEIRNEAARLARSPRKHEAIVHLFSPKRFEERAEFILHRTDITDLIGRELLKYLNPTFDSRLKALIQDWIQGAESIQNSVPLLSVFEYCQDLARQYEDVLGGPGGLGAEPEEQPPESKRGVSLREFSTTALAAELLKRPVNKKLRQGAEIEVENNGRPRWRDDEKSKPADLRDLSAPAFLRKVWADKKTLYRGEVRDYDFELMEAVEGYLGVRKSRGLDAGEAKGLKLVDGRPPETHGVKRKPNKQKQTRAARNAGMRP